MKLRVARHTDKINEIVDFYTHKIGLKKLGEFKGHDGYNGVFLGCENVDWELEFTLTNESPNHNFDEDDLLVFYTKSLEEYREILKKFKEKERQPIKAKNPYWNKNGKLFLDPDGFGIVIKKPDLV